MSKHGRDGVFDGLTVEQFAALPAAWPDTIHVCGGLLIARIHPRHNRPLGDEKVLARALAYLDPDEFGGGLHRLTVRVEQITPRYGHLPRRHSDIAEQSANMYRDLLFSIFQLPVIELASAEEVASRLRPFTTARDDPSSVRSALSEARFKKFDPGLAPAK